MLRGMDRLSGLDASFLYLETPEQLLHVCAALVLDPATMPDGYDFVQLRQKVADAVSDVPVFRRKLKRVPLGIDHPVWVDDAHFSIDRHVHRMALPAPGNYHEAQQLLGHLAGQPMDRNRPLWQMYVVEGYEDGKVIVFAKMHHATVDGVSGANLISHLCSLEPDAPPLRLTEPDPLPRRPSDVELVGRAVVNNLTKPWQVAKLLSPTGKLVTRTVERARQGTAMAAPFTAPRTSFNHSISGDRTVGWTNLPLDDVKAVKTATGTTVNDVVLTVAGGALRRYLQQRDELPASTLTATVPVSVRAESSRAAGANKVSALFARLGTDIEDPVDRLTMMATANRHAKEHHKAISADTLQDWAEFAAPRTFGLAMRAYAGLRLADRHPVVHNLVISNVPGPPVPLFFAGARIESLYALGPVFHGAGLNITVVSTAGSLNVGVIACRQAVPQVDDLVGRFAEELVDLKARALA